MRYILIVTWSVLTLASASGATPLATVLREFERLSDLPRAAVAIDVCAAEDDPRDSRRYLSTRDRAAYDQFMRALGHAYAAARPTDAELEHVTRTFCATATKAR